MALPGVSTTITNGGLGRTVLADDRVMGLLLHGMTSAVGDRTPTVCYSFTETQTKINGVATGEANLKTVILEQIRDFYALAGDGAELWLLICDTSLTVTQLFDSTSATAPARLLMEASGGRICVMGYCRQKANSNVTAGIGDEIVSGILPAQTFAAAMATAQMPLRIVLDGSGFTGDPAALTNLKIQTANRVAVVIGRTASAVAGPQGACVGLLLGRLAAIPVQRNIGRVQDGMVANVAYLTATGPELRTVNKGTIAAIHDKGYIVLTYHFGRAGYFFANDPTAVQNSDDYARLSLGRTMDKVQRIIYQTYLPDLLDNVTVSKDTGKIIPTTLKYYEGKGNYALKVQMVDLGEISGASLFVDPNQDVLSTGILKVVVKVVPVGTNETISITLGLSNPLNVS